MTITDAVHEAFLKVPPAAWTPAVEPDGEIRDGAWVAELTGNVLGGWPQGMRLIVRKERPPPGAQLRFTDADGLRLTAFVANTTGVPIAALELRHRQRARAEDRIRNARFAGRTPSCTGVRTCGRLRGRQWPLGVELPPARSRALCAAGPGGVRTWRRRL
ncbi:Transposase DDE domain group 1 [Streptomyces sp. Ncost-T10-10d]|nr:Transposase DDE domain group 1 [Streptomyces sp. Ncost-T10-10d]